MQLKFLPILIFLTITHLAACGGGGKTAGSRKPTDSPNPTTKGRTSDMTLAPKFNLKLDTYNSCTDLHDDLLQRVRAFNARQDELRRQYKNHPQMETQNDKASAPSEGSEGKATLNQDSITNLQERGIDEADYVKKNEFHVYVLHGNLLEVLHADTLEKLGVIKLPFSSKETPNYSRFVSEERSKNTNLSLYTAGHRIVILGQDEDQTKVAVYETSDHSLPKLKSEVAVPGILSDSRLVGGHLFMIDSNKVDIDRDDSDSFFPYVTLRDSDFLGTQFHGIDCNKIVRSAANDLNFDFVTAFSLDIQSENVAESVKSVGLLGVNAGKNVYVGSNHIILFQDSYDFSLYASSEPIEIKGMLTGIAYDPETGDLTPSARGSVPGRFPKGQWSFKEFSDQTLAVATTTDQPLEGAKADESGRNHLFLLKQKDSEFAIAGKVLNYGKPHEDIRAVRYTEDMAYIVTFEKTDPLYAIDIKNRMDPQITAALEMPGFSMYMQPLNKQWLVGIGYDALDQGDFSLFQGIQVSVFKTGTTTERVDQKVFGSRGSSSEATWNHHAFFADHASGSFVVPMVLVQNSGGWSYSGELEYSGAIAFSVDGSGKLSEKARISHSDLSPRQDKSWQWWQNSTESNDINRVFKHHSDIISVSRFGLKVHDSKSFETKKAIGW